MSPKERAYEDVDWIRLHQDRVQWQVLVSTKMKFRVS